MSKVKLGADVIRHLKFTHNLTEVEIAKVTGESERKIYNIIYPPKTNKPIPRIYYDIKRGEDYRPSAFFVNPQIAYALVYGEWPE